MHSPIAVESKYNCDCRANYWQQLSLFLSLRLSPYLSLISPSLRCGINHHDLCHVQLSIMQVDPMQSNGSFALKLELGDEQLHSIALSSYHPLLFPWGR